MGVRTIGYRFTGDYRDLDQALDRMDARIAASVASADKASKASGVAAGEASKGTATVVKASADTVEQATARVATAQANAGAAAQTYARAQATSATAAKASAQAQEKAAASAAVAAAKTGTAAEQGAAKQVAAADRAAAKSAQAFARTAAAAETAARREVSAIERAVRQETAARERAARQAVIAEKRSADEIRRVRERRAQASTDVGQGLLIAGAATAVGIGIAVKSFADFDQAMSRVSAGTEAVGADLGRLRTAALEAGAGTQFSATEAADAITALGKAGVSTNDILGGGLKGSLDLAAAGALSVADAAEIGATALVQFGLKGSDLPHVADLLAAGAGKAQGEVTDLAAALKYIGPVAASMGVSIEETTGVLAQFASQGIIGEQAGTSFRGILLSLTSPSKIAAKEMKALGIELYDARGNFVGMTGVAGQLQAALGGMSAAQRDASLGVLFGNEQVTAARVLYAGGADAIRTWTDRVNDAGFASRQAARLTDNLTGDLERLKGALSSAFIESGSGADGFLRNLTQGATSAVEAFSGLPDELQHGILGFAAIAAAASLAGGAMLVLIPKIAATRLALAELGFTAGATRGALATLGRATAILAALYAIGQGVEAIAPKAKDGAAGVTELAAALEKLTSGQDTGAITDLGSNFDDLAGKMQALADPGFMDRFADFTSFVFAWASGSTEGSEGRQRLLADFEALDKHLSGLIGAGKGEQAAKEFDALNAKAIAGGQGVDQLSKHLPLFTEAADAAAVAAGVSASQIQNMGDNSAVAALQAAQAKTALDEMVEAAKKATGDAFASATDILGTFDPEKQGEAEERRKDATDRLSEAQERLRETEARIGAGRKKDAISDRLAEDRAEAAAKRASDRKTGATKAEQAAADRAKGSAEKTKAGRDVSDLSDASALRRAREAVADAQKDATEAAQEVASSGLAATYRDTIEQASKFTEDISTALTRGLDPRYVQELLEQGPKEAGPILREILGDHSGRMIEMVNSSESKLARLNELAIEQARLTATAIASGTDQMTRDLAEAVEIAGAKSKLGAKATASAIAEQLRLPTGEVERIAGEFGITMMRATQAEVNKSAIDIRGKGKLSIETVGTKRAIERIEEVRRAAAKLRDKKINVTVVNRTVGQLQAINAERAPRNATGGKFRGAGGTTDDRNLSWISDQEWIMRAAAGHYYGDPFMSAINQMRIPREALPGFADGGRPGLTSSYASTASAAVATATPAPARQPAPHIVRVPVHESHTRTIQTGDLVLPAATPRDFEDWADDQRRRAERSFS